MKRIIATLMILALMATMLLSFAACGKAGAEKDLENVKEKGTLVVGMECAYAPYNWAQAESNEYTVKLDNGMYADGYDIQIAKKVAEAIGVTLVIKPIEWDGLIPALESGEIDMIIAGMSPTEKRKLSIDFSDTYFDSNLVMVVKNNGPYASATSIQDFSGAKITGQLNTFHYDVIDQITGVTKETALADFSALIQSLASGAIDGYVCEKPGAVSAVASNPEFTYVEFAEGKGFTCDPAESSISVGVRKGSNLTAEINKVVSSLTKAEKEALMDAAISRQPSEE
ncbi:MAG: transporter substrate-binding domain-containing protein [Ruminococcaceae bacterium]|nr:transporter substrate-binding domain-containing protein [Oscillospiraceae bacterium]